MIKLLASGICDECGTSIHRETEYDYYGFNRYLRSKDWLVLEGFLQKHYCPTCKKAIIDPTHEI
jgi:endogenous inhibitor of DNA gyrase (YacG/DUF329 family)